MIMRAHGTTVLPYHNRWMDAFPPSKCCQIPPLKMLIKVLSDRVPRTGASMEKQLPGVGRYTQGIGLFFFDTSAAILTTSFFYYYRSGVFHCIQ
ncbi:hypothetical protein BS47DRAFT_55781 [Hydnum rufescens UP504]|uniref:Uncharacterized protein n=1 Tax=Hydnum rufescens UP504 TaxID=1448309 RepID=A0A9P6AS10_9AGAM|nr:hypothetical protein BS47DRAFT_55781 [Hydnum rufescens UP504]